MPLPFQTKQYPLIFFFFGAWVCLGFISIWLPIAHHYLCHIFHVHGDAQGEMLE